MISKIYNHDSHKNQIIGYILQHNFQKFGKQLWYTTTFFYKNLKPNQITFYMIFGYSMKTTNSLMFLKITKSKVL
jgi:hypothetical protein